MVKKPRKRLAMYRTLPDGTVEKEYISYDDPILAKVNFVSRSQQRTTCLRIIFVLQVPIQKRAEVEKEVVIAKDKTASNFKVTSSASVFCSNILLRLSEEQVSPMNRASP